MKGNAEHARKITEMNKSTVSETLQKLDAMDKLIEELKKLRAAKALLGRSSLNESGGLSGPLYRPARTLPSSRRDA